MKYGDKRDFPKIDIYMRNGDGTGFYLCSTTWARNCRVAVQHYLAKYPCTPECSKLVFARYRKPKSVAVHGIRVHNMSW